MATTQQPKHPLDGITRDFGIMDDKGRKIGAFVNVWQQEGDTGWRVCVGATRDGNTHGSASMTKPLDEPTVAAEIKRRLNDIRKRAERKFGAA